MTSSSRPRMVRALDANLVVYSLLDRHPASSTCEEFIRSHCGWLSQAHPQVAEDFRSHTARGEHLP